jgi:hypothetical protein
MVAGIEVAAAQPADEHGLRPIWHQRKGPGSTPMLLLADDNARPVCVVALGVSEGGGPLRSLEADVLAEVLRGVAGRPRLDAVREVAAELDRLDQGRVRRPSRGLCRRRDGRESPQGMGRGRRKGGARLLGRGHDESISVAHRRHGRPGVDSRR